MKMKLSKIAAAAILSAAVGLVGWHCSFIGNGKADISLSVAHGDNIRSAEGVDVCNATE